MKTKSLEISEKRTFLRQLTNMLITSAKLGGIEKKPNELLKEHYKRDGHTVLKSFAEWKEAGFSVKKGEKALLLWGKPKGGKIVEENENAQGDNRDLEEMTKLFFPLCYVFSNKQVQRIINK